MEASANLVGKLKKQCGKESVSLLGAGGASFPSGFVYPGHPALALAIGGNTMFAGFPYGRMIEIYGPESSGKTTLALHALASAQANGQIAHFIDTEHSLSPSYAHALGVDTDALLFSQPTSAEEALNLIEPSITFGTKILILDSVAALVPEREIDNSIGESSVGLHARLMSQTMRKLTGPIARHGACVIFVNQIREKIGVPNNMSPETTTGGRALRFYSSVRLDVRRIGKASGGMSEDGNRISINVRKNKMARPFCKAEANIEFGKGLDEVGGWIELGVQYSAVQRSGAWYSTNEGERLGQGLNNTIEYLIQNPEILNGIKQAVMDRVDKIRLETEKRAPRIQMEESDIPGIAHETPEEFYAIP